MENLGKSLNQHKFEELVQGTCLECLTLDEIIDIAINGEGMNYVSNGSNFWNFAGAYYRFTGGKYFVIIIDRKQATGGINNCEIKFSLNDDYIWSDSKLFKKLLCEKVIEKTLSNEK